MNVVQAGYMLCSQSGLDYRRDCRILHVRFRMRGIRIRILGGRNHRAAEQGGEDRAACRKIGFHDSSILVKGRECPAFLRRLPFATVHTKCAPVSLLESTRAPRAAGATRLAI